MKKLIQLTTFEMALWQQICASIVMLWAIVIVTTSTFSYYIFEPKARLSDTMPSAILKNVVKNGQTVLENNKILRIKDSLERVK